MAKHPIVHVEIPASSREQAADFYSSVFDWQFQQHPEMNYATFAAEGGPGGGLSPTEGDMGATPGEVTVYVWSDDIDGTLAKIEANGGQTVLPKTEIPGVGWFALFNDPTGNRLALFYTDSEPGPA